MTTASDLRPLPATQDPLVERAAETAHDFNNLLGVIIANLDLLADELKAAPGASHLIDEAMTAAIRGSGLARDLLRATRGSAAEPGGDSASCQGDPTEPRQPRICSRRRRQ